MRRNKRVENLIIKNERERNMRTKDDILENLIEECPWVIPHGANNYILEAMQIYADEYHKEKANEAKTSTESVVCSHIIHEPDAAKGNYHCGKCGEPMEV